MEELILKKAQGLFFTYGIKGVSMDDIAKNAGISKKTIYNVLRDKVQLVEMLVSHLLECYAQVLKQSAEQSRDAVEEVVLVKQSLFDNIGFINPISCMISTNTSPQRGY